MIFYFIVHFIFKLRINQAQKWWTSHREGIWTWEGHRKTKPYKTVTKYCAFQAYQKHYNKSHQITEALISDGETCFNFCFSWWGTQFWFNTFDEVQQTFGKGALIMVGGLNIFHMSWGPLIFGPLLGRAIYFCYATFWATYSPPPHN